MYDIIIVFACIYRFNYDIVTGNVTVVTPCHLKNMINWILSYLTGSLMYGSALRWISNYKYYDLIQLSAKTAEAYVWHNHVRPCEKWVRLREKRLDDLDMWGKQILYDKDIISQNNINVWMWINQGRVVLRFIISAYPYGGMTGWLMNSLVKWLWNFIIEVWFSTKFYVWKSFYVVILLWKVVIHGWQFSLVCNWKHFVKVIYLITVVHAWLSS